MLADGFIKPLFGQIFKEKQTCIEVIDIEEES